MSPATKDDYRQRQSGRHDGFKQQGTSRLAREVVSRAVKEYMKKRIEKKAETFIDETQP